MESGMIFKLIQLTIMPAIVKGSLLLGAIAPESFDVNSPVCVKLKESQGRSTPKADPSAVQCKKEMPTDTVARTVADLATPVISAIHILKRGQKDFPGPAVVSFSNEVKARFLLAKTAMDTNYGSAIAAKLGGMPEKIFDQLEAKRRSEIAKSIEDCGDAHSSLPENLRQFVGAKLISKLKVNFSHDIGAGAPHDEFRKSMLASIELYRLAKAGKYNPVDPESVWLNMRAFPLKPEEIETFLERYGYSSTLTPNLFVS
jgi:hypothetical protein